MCSDRITDIGLTTSQFVTTPKHIARWGFIGRGLTTSQFVTTPKRRSQWKRRPWSLTTSQFVTTPKLQGIIAIYTFRLTTSQFVTTPKQRASQILDIKVWLPVSLSLLQNRRASDAWEDKGLTTSQFVTTPKRRRSTGKLIRRLTTSQFVTTPKPHSKFSARLLFDYQSVCHYSKTLDPLASGYTEFDYQSVCHYSKTDVVHGAIREGLTTSQFVTTPKPARNNLRRSLGLTTSQFVTTPKLKRMHHVRRIVWLPVSLSLLQNHAPCHSHHLRSLTTSQFVTTPKPAARN